MEPLVSGLTPPLALTRTGRAAPATSSERYRVTSLIRNRRSLARVDGRAAPATSNDNLLVRLHVIIEMIWWTGLAPWKAPATSSERCRGTSLIRNNLPVGPYSRPMPRALMWSSGVGVFLWARYPCRWFRDPSIIH